MNIPNLKKLVKHLEKQQKSQRAARFNMRYWGDRFISKDDSVGCLKTPVCKTQACLAGETVLAFNVAKILPTGGIFLTDYPFSGTGRISDVAAEKLGLGPVETARLFTFKSWGPRLNGWPEEFETAYEQAKTPAKRLAVTIQRVKHFIKTNGAE